MATDNTILGSGGEEWLSMDGTIGYTPQQEQEVIRSAAGAISEHRMQDAELRLLDREGNPLSGEVEISQQSSPFLWGDQLWELDRRVRNKTQDQDDCIAWRKMFADLFTSANALHYWTERPENDGPKSEEFQGYPQYDHLHWCVDWANSEGLTVKGHPLFWTVPKAVPTWLKRYDYETQLKFLEVRIRTITNRFRGKIKLYDAVNEPLWEPALKNLPSRHWPHVEELHNIADYIGMVLNWAREEDPDALYLVNEYGVMAGDDTPLEIIGNTGKAVSPASQLTRLIELLKELQNRGHAPDALGLQSHTGGWGNHAGQMQTYDELYSATDLPIHITEFWAKTGHLEEQGMPQDEIDAHVLEYITNYITCAFGHPAVDSFFFWGTTKQLIRFKDDGGWQLTPIFHGLKKLIHETWRTNTSANADNQGQVKFRGFHGDYQLKLKAGDGETHKFEVQLQKGKDIHTQTLVSTKRA